MSTSSRRGADSGVPSLGSNMQRHFTYSALLIVPWRSGQVSAWVERNDPTSWDAQAKRYSDDYRIADCGDRKSTRQLQSRRELVCRLLLEKKKKRRPPARDGCRDRGQRDGRRVRRVGPRVTARLVAIDGPAGSGKSTAARGVADALGLHTLDTGAMYRAVTLAA